MRSLDEICHYIEFVHPLYSHKDVGHDFQHIKRIVSRLGFFAEGLEPAPAKHKLNFLACFHGLSGKVSNNRSLKGEVTSFLSSLGWQHDDIEASFTSLRTHLTSPNLPEEKIVHDANYFEVTGAFGIAKAFTVGGARGQSYEQTIEFFEANLNGVSFQTPAGQQLYERRKAYARDYLRMLKAEL